MPLGTACADLATTKEIMVGASMQASLEGTPFDVHNRSRISEETQGFVAQYLANTLGTIPRKMYKILRDDLVFTNLFVLLFGYFYLIFI